MTAYRFTDRLTQAYLMLVCLLIVIAGGGAVPYWGGWLAAHGLAIALLHLLIVADRARPAWPGLALVREFLPVLLFPGLYRATGSLNQLFQRGYADGFFESWDVGLFGFSPGVRFMAAFPLPWLSELLHAAYFSYYLMVVGVGVALWWRSRSEFRHYVAVLSFVFYACYVVYLFLPVVGPRRHELELAGAMNPGAVVAEVPAAVQAGFFYQLMAIIYRLFEAPGAAFPSSHVAVALLTLHFTWRYLPRFRVIHLVAVVLLGLATVYGRYHYVVDVVAGALVAAVLVPVGNRLYARFARDE